jgi:cytoskeletal protein RodZ
MMINRDNYEEFFLLYVDNELTEADKKAVESFLQQNPDLAEELGMLMHLRLRADEEIIFENKQLLRRSEIANTPGINSENYTEFLLSFVDQELNREEENALEEFLKRNPQAKQELDILLRAKLDPDSSVVFPGKSLLYKTTKVPSKLVGLNWWRVAAAAAVILVAGLIWIILQDNDAPLTNPQLAQDSNSLKKENISPSTVTKNETDRIANITGEKEIDPQETNRIEKEEARSALQVTSLDNSKKKTAIREQLSTEVEEDKPGAADEKNAIARVEPNAVSAQENPGTQVIDQISVNHLPAIQTAPEIIDRPALSADVKTDYASEALLKNDYEIEAGSADELQQKKGLFRGLIRKANRVFNKVTNPEPGRPVMRVANFELALAK